MAGQRTNEGGGPVGDLGLPVCELFHGAWAEAEGRDAGRAAERLLCPGIGGVHTPLVEVDWDARDGCDKIADEEAVVAVAQIADAVQGLAGTGRSLGVHEGQQPWLVLLDCCFDLGK
jgi:hypothetical protein